MSISENIVITIRGAGISPERLSAEDLSDVILSVERSVASIVKRENPALSDQAIIVGLTKIDKSRSAVLVLSPSDRTNQLPAFDKWTYSINNDAFDDVPKDAIEGAKTLVRVSRRLGSTISLSAKTNGRASEAEIRPETKVTTPEPVYIKGETILYGKVIEIGGATKTQVKIRLPDEILFHAKVDEDLARSLGPHLYKWIGLKGIAKWDASTLQVEDFEVTGIVNYTDKPITQVLEDVAEIAGRHYRDIVDPVDYITRLRSE